MHRFPVLVTLQREPVRSPGTAMASPGLIRRLGLFDGRLYWLCLGNRRVTVQIGADSGLGPGEICLEAGRGARLGLSESLAATAWRTEGGAVRLGPLVGLLIAEAKLQAVLAGGRDTVLCRYSRAAREVGALLLIFAASGLDEATGSVRGWLHRCDHPQQCEWQAVSLPVPRVIYDRCFGTTGREQALVVRAAAERLHVTVVNHLPKITKMQAFRALGQHPELAAYLPYTAPLAPESLKQALRRYDDIYLKPDALYKGQGIFRLLRDEAGWRLQSRGEDENISLLLGDEAAVCADAADRFGTAVRYVVQEGLNLAAYLGNRFDFRSLVQRGKEGEWEVTGLVARIAPEGSVITSPRSGGQIAPAERVLRHAFPESWQDVLERLRGGSIQLARAVNEHLGPCVELGLDVGVTRQGEVRLIEVNGKPLRVSLERLKDPLITQQIHRWPILCAAHLEMGEVDLCKV